MDNFTIAVLAVIIAAFTAGLLAWALWLRSRAADREHERAMLAETRLQRALDDRDAANAAAPPRRRALTVLPTAPASCASCMRFDLTAGQRELSSHPPFWAAAQSVPPWRMGRVLKKDDDGADLPFDQQGIDPALLEMTWSQAGLCRAHREIRFATQPACAEYAASAPAANGPEAA